jgi:hypothetical protein
VGKRFPRQHFDLAALGDGFVPFSRSGISGPRRGERDTGTLEVNQTSSSYLINPSTDPPLFQYQVNMQFPTSIFFAAVSLLGTALAHNIQLAAHGRECFHEQLHKDDKMTVTFQVGDREFGAAGNLHVDFWVCHYERSCEQLLI